MFQVFKTFFRKTDIRGNGEKKNGNNPVHFHQTRKISLTFYHRDKTREQMPAKMFPHWKLLCWLFMGPTLGFNT